MHGNKIKFAFMTLAVFALIGYSGCILSPNEEVPVKPPVATYKSLTDKENLIYNLMQCYKEHNKNRFIELLHTDYVWYNQAGSNPEYLTRTQDIDQTSKMFDAAEGNYPNPDLWIDKLELSIVQQGVYWTPLTEIEGVPCTDCWETTRDYYITAVVNGGNLTYIGNDLVKFIAIGVDKDGQRIYQLRRADDIKRPS
jgi:hypothetical protein